MTKDLSGDRHIEYGWVSRCLPSAAEAGKAVFDLGPAENAVTLKFALARGYDVTAIGLMPIQITHPSLHFIQADFLEHETGQTFDYILNISTIEHFGLAGRYGVTENQVDADLAGMARLQSLLGPNGQMLLTIPVGRDAVVRPYHRVYGRERLPLLLRGYTVIRAEYWGKKDTQFWDCIDEHEAFDTIPAMRIPTYYALGLFVCKQN